MEPTQGSTPEQPSPTRHSETRHDLEVRVRRSPKYGAFMAIGALVGAVVAWLVSVNVTPGLSETGQRVDTTPVIGLVVVGGFVVGAALGAAVALAFDRALSKRTHTEMAERVDVTETDASAVAVAPADVGEAEFEHLDTVDPRSATGAHGPGSQRHDERQLDGHGDTSPQERDRPLGA